MCPTSRRTGRTPRGALAGVLVEHALSLGMQQLIIDQPCACMVGMPRNQIFVISRSSNREAPPPAAVGGSWPHTAPRIVSSARDNDSSTRRNASQAGRSLSRSIASPSPEKRPGRPRTCVDEQVGHWRVYPYESWQGPSLPCLRCDPINKARSGALSFSIQASGLRSHVLELNCLRLLAAESVP